MTSVTSQTTHQQDNEKLALAAEIIKGRERLGMTQAQLATASAVSLSAIKGYETGRSFPGAKELRQICLTLRISPNLLLFGDEAPFRSAEPTLEAAKGLRIQRGRIGLLVDMLSIDESNAVYALVHAIALARFGVDGVTSRLEIADFSTGLSEIQRGEPLDPELFRLLFKNPEATREFIAAGNAVIEEISQAKNKKSQKKT